MLSTVVWNFVYLYTEGYESCVSNVLVSASCPASHVSEGLLDTAGTRECWRPKIAGDRVPTLSAFFRYIMTSRRDQY